MRRFWMTALAVLIVSGLAAAQRGGSGTSTSTSTSSTKDQAKTESKDKKKDKKKKDEKKSGDSLARDVNATFSRGTAEDLLGQVRDGLEGHMYRSMLRAFDGDKMDGYLSFEDQLEHYFEKYSAFRMHYRIADVTVEGNKGVALVDVELEQTPANNSTPQRKRAQLRFVMENSKKGWKIVDLQDRGFFS